MTDNQALAKGITRELQGLGKVVFSQYISVVQSRNLSEKQEEVLIQYASDVYVINNVQWQTQSQQTQQTSIPRRNSGFGGLLNDIVDVGSDIIDVASDIVRIPVGIVGGTVSLGKEMLVDSTLEMIVGSPEEIVSRTQPYMTETMNNPYNATKKRESDLVTQLNSLK